jgi:hypothetical protein
MTIQPTGEDRRAHVPNTVPGILIALPQHLRAAFRTELATALEHGDPATVDAIIGAWWAQAVRHVDPSARVAFAALDDGTAQGTATTNRPGARALLLSVFAVRAELAPFSDTRVFDREIDTVIGHIADTGSFDRLRTVLRTWLGIAVMARYTDQHESLPREMEQRAKLQQELVEQWLHKHPEATH